MQNQLLILLTLREVFSPEEEEAEKEIPVSPLKPSQETDHGHLRLLSRLIETVVNR